MDDTMKTTEKNGAKVKVDGDGVDEEAAAQQAEDVAGAVAGEGGDDDEQEEVDAVAQAVADEAAEAVIAGDDSQTPSKRRFFPRVKHLLTPEWEFFLQGVLNSLESAGAHHSAAASHKASNPWYKSFHSIYGGVASDCSVPTGKNRYHKFKDKIVELWVAMDQHETYNGPLRDMAVRQLTSYRQACENKTTVGLDGKPEKVDLDDGKDGNGGAKVAATPAKGGKNPGDKMSGTAGGGGAAGGAKSNPNKRSHQTSASSGSASSKAPPPPQSWAHLDEAAALATLPQPLQTLIHLRHMGVEVQSQDTVLVEEAYQRALNSFLDDPKLCKPPKKGASKEDGDSDNTANKASKTPEDLYSLCQAMVLLWRCSKRLQKSQESKAILYTYHNIVQEYLQAIQQQEESPPPVMV